MWTGMYSWGGGAGTQIFNQLIPILWLGWSVSKYVSNRRIALFICISETILWNLIKLCMHVDIGYAVILFFHDVQLRGQTNVAYIKICYKTSFFICISRSIFWNLPKLCMNFNIEYAVILLFQDFHLRGQTTVAYV